MVAPQGRVTPPDRLEQRVVRAAEEVLSRQRYVAPVDVLLDLGWLHQSQVDAWRQGRVECLERVVDANLAKISKAMGHLRRWARDRGLSPSETAYVAWARDRRPLRFSRSGAPAIEQAYRTHWVAPDLSPARRERLRERQSRPPDLVVIEASRDWACSRCGADRGRGNLLLMECPGPVCMACAGLVGLVFLPAGDATLTRRARRLSRQPVVVVRFSRARKRYERQGLLVEEAALARAEDECRAGEDAEHGSGQAPGAGPDRDGG